MVFDIKMEGFQQKTCQVVGVNMTQMLVATTYSSKDTKGTAHIALRMEVLHYLAVTAAKGLTANVMTPNRKRYKQH